MPSAPGSEGAGRRAAGGGLWRWLVALAALFVVGAGSYGASAVPAWTWGDEQAHVGYASALARGQLPTVDSPIVVAGDSEALVMVLGPDGPNGELGRYQGIWVANHPPGAYLPAVPGVVVAERLESERLAVMSVRMANVVGFAAAVVASAALARELTGRRSAAVVAAWLVALNPYVGFVGAVAMSDGWSLAAVVAALWASLQALRSAFDRNSTLLLSAACVACGLTRLTSLVAAGTAVLVVLAVHWTRHRSVPWSAVVTVSGATVVASGWWWVRNVFLYGDVAGSEVLYERFGRTPTGSVGSVTVDVDVWQRVAAALFLNGRDASSLVGTDGSRWAVGMVVVASLVVVLVEISTGRAAVGPWLVVVATAAVAGVLMAVHVAGGGNAFGRYVLLWVPLAAVVVAAALTSARVPRAVRMVAGASVMSGAAWLWMLRTAALRSYAEPRAAKRLGATGPPLAGEALQVVGLVTAGTAAAVAAAALLWFLVRRVD